MLLTSANSKRMANLLLVFVTPVLLLIAFDIGTSLLWPVDWSEGKLAIASLAFYFAALFLLEYWLVRHAALHRYKSELRAPPQELAQLQLGVIQIVLGIMFLASQLSKVIDVVYFPDVLALWPPLIDSLIIGGFMLITGLHNITKITVTPAPSVPRQHSIRK